jgi:hypothetical protein
MRSLLTVRSLRVRGRNLLTVRPVRVQRRNKLLGGRSLRMRGVKPASRTEAFTRVVRIDRTPVRDSRQGACTRCESRFGASRQPSRGHESTHRDSPRVPCVVKVRASNRRAFCPEKYSPRPGIERSDLGQRFADRFPASWTRCIPSRTARLHWRLPHRIPARMAMPNASYRNIQRAGFTLSHVRRQYVTRSDAHGMESAR